MSMKPGVTRSPSASIVCVAAASTRPMAATLPSAIATSAVRAGAPLPSTTLPPVIRRSNTWRSEGRDRDPVHVERVEPEERSTGVVGQIAVVLAQFVDHARILSVVVREVRGPDEAVVAGDRAERAGGALTGVEADPALALEVVLGVERHRRGGPPVALFELVEAVHPVCDPPTAALEHRDLQGRVALEHTSVDEVREREH